jgi:hypothetical protein
MKACSLPGDILGDQEGWEVEEEEVELLLLLGQVR